MKKLLTKSSNQLLMLLKEYVIITQKSLISWNIQRSGGTNNTAEILKTINEPGILKTGDDSGVLSKRQSTNSLI